VIAAPKPSNEAERLAALRQLRLLDTLPEQVYDDLALLASHICSTPISLVTLVDHERQWFKARVGITMTETSRDASFCAHAIVHPTDVLTVADTQRDPRFWDNPFVTGEPMTRFYAGAPIVTAHGEALGTVCVIDRKPRELGAREVFALQALARQAAALFRLRARVFELEDRESAAKG
jgi:GAF domain-containing protein